MHVHLGSRALPGSVGADERSDGVHVMRPVRAVVCQQPAEHLIDQRLGLSRAAGHQQPGAVSVPDDRDGVGLGDAQRPERFLGGVGRPVSGSDQIAHADATA